MSAPAPTERPPVEASRERRGIPGPALALGAAALTALIAMLGMLATGAGSPGRLVPVAPVVTWGTPIVRALHHGALLGTIGAGWIAVLLMPPDQKADGTRLRGRRRRLVRIGAGCALVWSAASLVLALLGAAEAAGAHSTASLPQIAGSTDLGRTQIAVAVAALLAALFSGLARSTVAAAWGLAAGVIGVALLGLSGHADASLDHANAVNAMAVHLLGMSVWAGPLLVMLCCRRTIGPDLPVVVRRFSPWALAGVVALAASGVMNAWIRLDAPLQLLTTPYGRLVALKALGLLALAALGAVQRRRLGDTLRFRHLAITESALLAAVVGMAIALGRTAPPAPQDIPAVGDRRVLSLIGYAPPRAPFSVATLFTQVQPDLVAIGVGASMAGLYLAGVARLRRRGDAWSMLRTVPFVLGCLALVWVTSGGPNAYGRVRFDAHMVQHMSLMMIVPPLWVLGAPVTLLTRALPARTDGSRGVREWVLAVLHSRYAQVISFPPVAGVIFAGSLIAFYFTPAFSAAMFTHVGHVIMTAHFLLAGYLFAWVLIGVDPAPRPLNPVLKLVTLLITLSFHAFFGVAVVSATWIIGQDWYAALGLHDLEQLALIQKRGGSIMWGVSEVPTLFYAIILAVQWTGSEDRKARQYDRKADRDQDAELVAYNEYLRGLRERGGDDVARR